MQDKFRLDLPDEEAVHYIQNIIDESATAVMPVVVEQIHRIAQVSSLLQKSKLKVLSALNTYCTRQLQDNIYKFSNICMFYQ